MRVSFVIHPRIHSYQAKRNWTQLCKDKETLQKLIGGVALITYRFSHRDTQNTPPTNKRVNTQIVTHRISLHGICKKDIQTQGRQGQEVDHLHNAIENR